MRAPTLMLWLCCSCAHVVMRADAMKASIPAQFEDGTPLEATVALDVSSLTDDPVCSHFDGLRDLCVTNLRAAFSTGLMGVTQRVFTPGPRSVVVHFHIDGLTHRPTSLNSGGWSTNRVDLAWSLRVNDHTVHHSTPSPQPITWGGAHNETIARLVAATLADVAQALRDSR